MHFLYKIWEYLCQINTRCLISELTKCDLGINGVGPVNEVQQ
jgi:hypothetical protein